MKGLVTLVFVGITFHYLMNLGCNVAHFGQHSDDHSNCLSYVIFYIIFWLAMSLLFIFPAIKKLFK